MLVRVRGRAGPRLRPSPGSCPAPHPATHSRSVRRRLSAGASPPPPALKRLDPALVAPLMRLQQVTLASSKELDLGDAVASLSQWRKSLALGVVPDTKSLTVPREPLLTAWTTTLLDIDMPRFTRRHPLLLGLCLQNMLDLATAFELEQQRMRGEDPQDPDEHESNDGEIGGSGSGEGGDGDQSMPGGEDGEGSEGGDGGDEMTDGQAGGSQASDGREQEAEASEMEDGGDGGGGQATEGDGGNAQGGSGSGRGQQSAPNFDQMLDSQSISLDMDEGEGGGGGDAALSARQRPTQIFPGRSDFVHVGSTGC